MIRIALASLVATILFAACSSSTSGTCTSREPMMPMTNVRAKFDSTNPICPNSARSKTSDAVSTSSWCPACQPSPTSRGYHFA